MDQQVLFDKDLSALENSLRANLHRLEPDQIFIHELAHDLADASIHVRQKRIGQALLLATGGLVIGFLIFFIGRGFLDREKAD